MKLIEKKKKEIYEDIGKLSEEQLKLLQKFILGFKKMSEEGR